MNGQPKPGFYFVVLLVILALVGYGMYRMKTPTDSGASSSAQSQQDGGGSDAPVAAGDGGAEAPDSTGITTVKEYAYVPSQRQPDDKCVSN